MKRRRAKPDASIRYHDRVARRYDAMYDDLYWEFIDRLAWESIAPWLPRDLSAQCCDLGCGTGKWGAKLLKSGFATTFVDHSAAMIEQARAKIQTLGPKAKKGTLLVADIVDLSPLPAEQFDLILAMGDPLSICSDALAALRQMHRICKPAGTIIATADNRLAAIDHFLQRGDIDGLETLLRTGKTHWLTPESSEQFELTTFSPAQFTRLVQNAGLEVVKLTGRTILPIRQFRDLLDREGNLDRLMKLERDLSQDTSAAARAGHLQIVARRPANA